MNSHSSPFVGYKDIPSATSRKPTTDYSLSSPPSDTTTQYAHSISPNLHEFPPASQDIQFEAWNYGDNYDFQDEGAYRADPLSVKVEADDKLSAKSKRIMKRNAAKERTKTRKDAESFLEGVDKKFLPEGFDDPDLDEKTKKKMVQMVRNRISAQNSRDRKKVFMQQLEEVNSQLVDEITALKMEKTTLMNEITRLQQSEAQLIMENQALKNENSNNLCSSCKRSVNEGDLLQYTDFNIPQQPTTEENSHESFSNLSSPILSRFSSNGRGLFTFFTFAALACIILIVNMNPSGEIALQGGRRVMDTRMLEVKNEYCRDPMNIFEDGKAELPYKNSLVIRNIEPLMSHFDLHYARTFKSHLQKNALLDITSAQPQSESTSLVVKYEEPKFQNAIVDYDYFKAANLRKKSPTIIARNLPQLGESGNGVKTSTLFCPSGFEFIEPENQNENVGQKEVRDRLLDLESADYLQLFVPRHGMVRYNVHHNMSTLYDLPVISEENENAMLEIWAKVFLIRDLSSNL